MRSNGCSIAPKATKTASARQDQIVLNRPCGASARLGCDPGDVRGLLAEQGWHYIALCPEVRPGVDTFLCLTWSRHGHSPASALERGSVPLRKVSSGGRVVFLNNPVKDTIPLPHGAPRVRSARRLVQSRNSWLVLPVPPGAQGISAKGRASVFRSRLHPHLDPLHGLSSPR